ncbi:MAG: MBL fold metallo-hydrolase, partial [Myxococcota bacterium]
SSGAEAPSPNCEGPVALQVLGSGGPIADDGRASAGYLIWVDGRARVLVDAGGGTFLRFAQSGASFDDLQLVLLTHHHADHTSDLPALLKSASFGSRREDLPVAGPSGNERFPPLEEFLRALLGDEDGAFRYLGGYLQSPGEPFALRLKTVDVEREEPTVVHDEDGLRVRGMGVRHGIVPALGYVIEVQGKRIAFTGDQRMDDPRFEQMIEGADLLVAHHAIPEDAGDAARALHATPSRIGQLAAGAEVGRVVLSHHMGRSLRDREGSEQNIRSQYDGPLQFAEDLDCFAP